MCVGKLIHPLKPLYLIEKPFIVWLYLPTGICIKWKKEMLYKKCLYMYSVYTCTPICSFTEIDHEIFSMVILSRPLIQERQL